MIRRTFQPNLPHQGHMKPMVLSGKCVCGRMGRSCLWRHCNSYRDWTCKGLGEGPQRLGCKSLKGWAQNCALHRGPQSQNEGKQFESRMQEMKCINIFWLFCFLHGNPVSHLQSCINFTSRLEVAADGLKSQSTHPEVFTAWYLSRRFRPATLSCISLTSRLEVTAVNSDILWPELCLRRQLEPWRPCHYQEYPTHKNELCWCVFHTLQEVHER